VCETTTRVGQAARLSRRRRERDGVVADDVDARVEEGESEIPWSGAGRVCDERCRRKDSETDRRPVFESWRIHFFNTHHQHFKRHKSIVERVTYRVINIAAALCLFYCDFRSAKVVAKRLVATRSQSEYSWLVHTPLLNSTARHPFKTCRLPSPARIFSIRPIKRIVGVSDTTPTQHTPNTQNTNQTHHQTNNTTQHNIPVRPLWARTMAARRRCCQQKRS
jgi:hypothetical protein